MKTTVSLFRVLPAALLLPAAATWAQDINTLQWKPTGLHEVVHGYRPHSVRLAADAPEGTKKLPEGLKKPSYGVIKVGPASSPANIALVVDWEGGRPSRVFVDANANGDLTDDPASTWTEKRFKRPEAEEESVSYSSEATVTIPAASGPRQGRIVFYCMEMMTMGENGKAKAMGVGYYNDFGATGPVKVGDKTYQAALDEASCTGIFQLGEDTMAHSILWLDLDGDGKPSGRAETIPIRKPFQADGKWWKVADLTPDGAFRVVASEAPPANPKPEGPDLSPGQKAPSFKGKLLDGKEVGFPEDYKGKVVLLDFWATWCGPCLMEVPNVVAAYGKFHGQGFEILGVSLDKEGMEQKLGDVTKAKNMTWPQVYDGQFWSAGAAKLYGIQSIPHMILVDGDTGVILADKDIRGEALAPAIEKALAGKKK